MSKAKVVFEKLAKFNVSDFESEYLAGTLLSDKGEANVKRMYAEEKSKRFPLRHPWLTGIPTLGLAPMISGHDAKSDIARKVLQKDKKFRKQYQKNYNILLELRSRERAAALGKPETNVVMQNIGNS